MLMTIIVLLFLYQEKHFFADYPLQGAYMLRKFLPGTAWIVPLTAHAGVHAGFTFAIVGLFSRSVWFALWCAVFDFVCHFIMDRIKASPDMLGKYKNFSGKEYVAMQYDPPMILDFENEKRQVDGKEKVFKKPILREATEAELEKIRKHNTLFWWALGLDQKVHHLTHYFIIIALVLYLYGIPTN